MFYQQQESNNQAFFTLSQNHYKWNSQGTENPDKPVHHLHSVEVSSHNNTELRGTPCIIIQRVYYGLGTSIVLWI